MKIILASAFLVGCVVSKHISSSTATTTKCITGANGVQPHDLLDQTGECRCPAAFEYDPKYGCVRVPDPATTVIEPTSTKRSSSKKSSIKKSSTKKSSTRKSPTRRSTSKSPTRRSTSKSPTKKSQSTKKSSSTSSHHCPYGWIPLPGTPGKCQCDWVNGFSMLDGKNCLKCPPHSWWSPAENDCHCEWGYYKKGKVCVLKK